MVLLLGGEEERLCSPQTSRRVPYDEHRFMFKKLAHPCAALLLLLLLTYPPAHLLTCSAMVCGVAQRKRRKTDGPAVGAGDRSRTQRKRAREHSGVPRAAMQSNIKREKQGMFHRLR